MDKLSILKERLLSLSVYRELLTDSVVSSLLAYIDNQTNSNYAEFVSQLYRANGGNLSEYIRDICENDENIYVQLIGQKQEVPSYIEATVESEIETLQEVADLRSDILTIPLNNAPYLPTYACSKINLKGAIEHRVRNISKYGYGIYAKNRMFYLDDDGRITPVNNPDSITFNDLVDYERERNIIIDNTKALLDSKPAANILLTGDAGTGKSSTIKAVCNELFSQGLRIIEVRKDQLCSIQKLLDQLSLNPLKFILFIDDLSFLKDDDNFNALKAVLEGSVSAKSQNVVIYATSNRRHIIKEKFSDREGDDVHRNDTMQELVSLSDRFGIHITFQKPDKNTYLHIVRHLANSHCIAMDTKRLEADAERFALERGSRSARLAKQFIDSILSK